MNRHRSPAKQCVVFVGDHLLIAAVMLAVRRPRSAAHLFIGTFAALLLGHVVFEGNARRGSRAPSHLFA